MAEIKAAQVWLTEEVLRRIKQHPRTSSGPVGSFVAIANTSENTEAIKIATHTALMKKNPAYRNLSYRERDVIRALLDVLSLTGGGDEG